METPLICSICQLRIKSGHRYLPFIPGGYGPLKDKGPKARGEGVMHVAHLSSTDWLGTLSKSFEEA